MNISSAKDLDGNINNRSNLDRRILSLKLDIQQSFRSNRFPLQLWWSEPFPIPSTNLSQNPHSRMSMSVIERKWTE